MINTLGIIMTAKPILEKDMLVELFTKDIGRVRVFAKYAQSKKPRFGGQLNTLNELNVTLFEKGDVFYLGDVSIQEQFKGIKTSFKRMHVAFQFLHVVRSITQLNHENQPVYTALHHYLKALEALDHDELMRYKLQFYHHILQIEGIITGGTKFNEKDAIKMIESYASIQLKDVL